MKYKKDYDIIDLLRGKSFEDGGSLYRLFVKDTAYEDNINKLSLVIISMPEEYVVNNDLKFNSLEVKGNEFIFYSVHNNKRSSIKYILILDAT